MRCTNKTCEWPVETPGNIVGIDVDGDRMALAAYGDGFPDETKLDLYASDVELFADGVDGTAD